MTGCRPYVFICLFTHCPGTAAARVVTAGLSVNNDGHGHALQSCTCPSPTIKHLAYMHRD